MDTAASRAALAAALDARNKAMANWREAVKERDGLRAALRLDSRHKHRATLTIIKEGDWGREETIARLPLALDDARQWMLQRCASRVTACKLHCLKLGISPDELKEPQ